MPGWIAPDNLGSILQDMQRQIRQLQTCIAAPINTPIMTQLFQNGSGNITSPNTTTFATVFSNSFTLTLPQTVLAFCSSSPVSNVGGSPNSNYQYLGLRIDGSPGSYFTAGVTTVGEGVQPCFLMAVGHSLAPGTHTVYLDYAFDVAGTTTSTVGNIAMAAFIIGA